MSTLEDAGVQTPVQAAATARISLMLIVVGLLLGLAFIVLLVFRLLPTGVPGQWEWPWREEACPIPPSQWLIPLVGLGTLLVLLRLLARPAVTRAAVASFLIVCCLATGATMLLLESAEPLPPLHLSQVAVSVPATGYLSYATSLSNLQELFTALSSDPADVPAIPCRVRTHPPGPVLLYYVGLRALEVLPQITEATERWSAQRYGVTPEVFHGASRWYAMATVQPWHFAPAFLLGLALTLLGALLPIPAHFVGTAIATRRTGLIAGFLVFLVPSLTVFIPSIDAFGAVLAMSVLALGLWALRQQRWWLYALAGLAVAAALLWSIGLAAVAVVLVAVALPHLRATDTRRRTVTGIVVSIAAFGAVLLLLHLAFGYSLPANIRLTMDAQRGVMQRAHRDYLTWLPGNLYEVMLFMGPALLMTALAGIPRLRQMPLTCRHYVLGALLTLLLVWLSGSTLGEVGRIWLFLMAMLIPAAALTLSDMLLHKSRPLLVLLTLSQAVLIVLLHGRLMLVHA